MLKGIGEPLSDELLEALDNLESVAARILEREAVRTGRPPLDLMFPNAHLVDPAAPQEEADLFRAEAQADG